ncbi:MAG: DUF1080 domain-containing protein [Rhodothermales bacterium]|nr:DUF1080 domain-containing protein [Rhodothermales bacterium]MBO6780899.1 DUF1080 domain-containing protein [Rhodothermales bacterium]
MRGLILAAVLVAGCGGARLEVTNDQEAEQWVQLFNGQDLTGWTPKIRGEAVGQDSSNTFRVEDGVIKVAYDGYGAFDERFGHLFYETPYSHYRLNILYRFTGDQAEGGPGWAFRNSGVMVHSQSASSMGLDQDFPISIEVQFLGGNGVDERPTANLCTPGTHVEMDGELVTDHCINAQSPTFHGDDWVEVEVVVLGDSLIAHAVEGEPVLGYYRPQVGGGVVDGFDPAEKRDGELLGAGYIALQSESHPVEFRRVELLNLSGCMDPGAANFRWWYEHDNRAACVYDD